MRDDTQLTQEERYQIEALLKMGHHQSEIAVVLKRDKSTISREVRRKPSLRGYRPKQAQHLGMGWESAARGLESGANQRLALEGAGAACQP